MIKEMTCMSKLSNAAMEMREEATLRRDETVVNFMGGDSYVINPLDTLKMITASSIYGEPSYYRDSASAKKTCGKYDRSCLMYLLCTHIFPSTYNGDCKRRHQFLFVKCVFIFSLFCLSVANVFSFFQCAKFFSYFLHSWAELRHIRMM